MTETRNFAKFTGKHLYQSLFFNKVGGLSPAILLKKILWNRCFPVNFAKFQRTAFLTEHFWWLLLNGNLYTDLHIESADCHQNRKYTSSHPEYTKKSIIYCQTLRLIRLYSFQQELEDRKRNLRSWLVKRRYPEEIIDKEMLKVKFNFPKKINPKE